MSDNDDDTIQQAPAADPPPVAASSEPFDADQFSLDHANEIHTAFDQAFESFSQNGGDLSQDVNITIKIGQGNITASSNPITVTPQPSAGAAPSSLE